MAGTGDGGQLTYPMARDGACPFAPPSVYDELRRSDPITRVTLYDGRSAWMFTRYEDIRTVLAHPTVSADTLNENFPFLSPGDKVTKQVQSFQRWDDPRHAERRRMLIPHFAANRVDGMRPRVRAILGDLYDKMVAIGPPLDLVEHLALALPSAVACELLGVPYEDHAFFESRFAVRLDRGAAADDVRRANAELTEYVDRVVSSKYGTDNGDLLGRFVRERVETGQVSHEDAVTDATLLLLAGHETTANMIALGVLALLEHPAELARIQADKGLVPTAVEELLRYLTVSHMMGVRVAKADFEVAGQAISAGDGLIVPVAAANYDDAIFADPQVLDVTRSARSHLAFGFGVHACLGQALARMELREVFSTVFERLPSLRLAIPLADVAFKAESVFYGVHALPVAWEGR
jgi:hypothetical protein